MTESVPTHPIAPRLKGGPKKPHVGPTIGDYKSLHAQTIGPGSDEYWTKASLNTVDKKTDDR
jgi:acetyl-CoA synthetase